MRAFSAGIVWGSVMLALGLGSGCGKGDNGHGSAPGGNTVDHGLSDVPGEIDPKWPSDKLPKSVPPIVGATVLSSMQDGDDFGVIVRCKRKSIDVYIQDLEKTGWNIDKDMGSDGNDELGAISRFLFNDEGEELQIFWHGGSGTLGYAKK